MFEATHGAVFNRALSSQRSTAGGALTVFTIVEACKDAGSYCRENDKS
jgi:hypothetical protein